MLQVNNTSLAYSYTEDIDELNSTVIQNARQKVNAFAKRGIIEGNFDDSIWIFDNETQKRTLEFPVWSKRLEQYCDNNFGFMAFFYLDMLKAYVVLNFGAAAMSLQVAVTALRKFTYYLIGESTIDDLKTQGANKIVDFISFLPENNELVDLCEELDAYICDEYKQGSEQRTLAQFRSYLKFESIMNEFWDSASIAERVQYFPVRCWWKLSTLIPLRPTEVVLTPRNCITNDGKLTIRRTKLKKHKNSSEYRLDADYTKCTYRVPQDLMNDVVWYIKATADGYRSDIDTLFMQPEVIKSMEIVRLNEHFTYEDMNRLLKRFYIDIIRGHLHYEVVDFADSECCELGDNQIEQITLGDTRHLAMVSIFLTTKNPELCRELAGHDDINISSRYYSNVANFIRAISFERVQSQTPIFTPAFQSKTLTPLNRTQIDGGFCLSEMLAAGDYSDCMRAVSTNGRLFDCLSCQYFISTSQAAVFDVKEMCQEKATDTEFKDAFDFLIYTIDQVRRNDGHEDDIQSAFLKMQAAAAQYENKLVQQYKLEKEWLTNVQTR